MYATFGHLTNEELITSVDMDMEATEREKELVARMALILDAMAETLPLMETPFLQEQE
jgi:hypothetical protein